MEVVMNTSVAGVRIDPVGAVRRIELELLIFAGGLSRL
jgi:hypothetical protein